MSRKHNRVRQNMASIPQVRNLTLHEKRCFPDSATADKKRQNRKPTVSAETKLILRGIKESPNAYPPLKSVAESLCLILDNCEV